MHKTSFPLDGRRCASCRKANPAMAFDLATQKFQLRYEGDGGPLPKVKGGPIRTAESSNG